MKDTVFATFGSIGLASALLIGALAQGNEQKKSPVNAAPKTVVALKCTLKSNSATATEVTLQNNTPAPIAQGVKLSWATNAGVKGAVVLASQLGAGQTVNGLAYTPGNSTACTASFLK